MEGWGEVLRGLLPRLKSGGADVLVEVGPELAAVLVPPKLGKGEGAAALVVAPAVDVVAPDVAEADAGADTAGFPNPNPPMVAPLPEPRFWNRLLGVAPVEAGVA